MTATLPPNVEDVLREFAPFWKQNEAIVTQVLKDRNLFIKFTEGTPREDRTRLKVDDTVVDDALVICQWGMQKACLHNGRYLVGKPITAEVMVEEFLIAYPDQSFMDTVRARIAELFS